MKKIFILTGEPSGDKLASTVIAKLKAKNYVIKYLSVGEKQRVAITRALIRPFTWLILDEPFSHLDKKNIQICIELIESNLNENNAGLILTSHSKNNMFKFNTDISLD